MAARGGGWPGTAEALHVSLTQPCSWFQALIIPQEIEIKGREVSRGDGNIVSIEYECLCYFLFEPIGANSNCLGSMFFIVGMQPLGKISMEISPTSSC